jgi:hypothetical protein
MGERHPVSLYIEKDLLECGIALLLREFARRMDCSAAPAEGFIGVAKRLRADLMHPSTFGDSGIEAWYRTVKSGHRGTYKWK